MKKRSGRPPSNNPWYGVISVIIIIGAIAWVYCRYNQLP